MVRPVLKAAARYRRHVPDGCPLTHVEFEVVELIAAGMTYQQVADERGRSISTIRTQLFNAYRRLGVHDGTQAVIKCFREGWIAGKETDETLEPLLPPSTGRQPSLPPSLRGETPEGCPLTAAELAVMEGLAHGASGSDEVAKRLGIPKGSVSSRAWRARERLGVKTNVQAVVRCVTAGWIGGVEPGAPSRDSDDDIEITDDHRRYLAAFELLLRAKTTEERDMLRTVMNREADRFFPPSLRTRPLEE